MDGLRWSVGLTRSVGTSRRCRWPGSRSEVAVVGLGSTGPLTGVAQAAQPAAFGRPADAARDAHPTGRQRSVERRVMAGPEHCGGSAPVDSRAEGAPDAPAEPGRLADEKPGPGCA